MRLVLAAAHNGDMRAQLAVDMYCLQVRQAIGAMAVTLGGVDTLVFTAGIGENSPEIRAKICDGLECLGLDLDSQRNAECVPDADIASPGSDVRVLVIMAREDLSMLRDMDEVLRNDE